MPLRQTFSHACFSPCGMRELDDVVKPCPVCSLCQYSSHPPEENDREFLLTRGPPGAQSRMPLPVTGHSGSHCALQAHVLCWTVMSRTQSACWGPSVSTIFCISLLPHCLQVPTLHWLQLVARRPWGPHVLDISECPCNFPILFPIFHHCPHDPSSLIG